MSPSSRQWEELSELSWSYGCISAREPDRTRAWAGIPARGHLWRSALSTSQHGLGLCSLVWPWVCPVHGALLAGHESQGQLTVSNPVYLQVQSYFLRPGFFTLYSLAHCVVEQLPSLMRHLMGISQASDANSCSHSYSHQSLQSSKSS